MTQGDRTLERLVVVGGLVGFQIRTHIETDRFIEEDRRPRIATVDGGRVEKRLEERPELPARLDGPVELAALEAVAANHRQDLARAVVEHQHRPVQDRLLLEGGGDHAWRFVDAGDAHVDQVARLDELGRGPSLRPREAITADLRPVSADADLHPAAGHPGHDRGNDVAGRDGGAPAVVLETLDRPPAGDDILRWLTEAMALVDDPESVAQGPVGEGLEPHIQRRLYLEPALIESLHTVVRLEVLPDLFDEVWSDRFVSSGPAPDLDRGRPGLVGFRRRNVAFLDHPIEDVIPPPFGRRGVHERALTVGRLDNSGEQCRLRQVDVAGGFVEVQPGSRLDAVGVMAEKDLVAVERENLPLGIALLDLDAQDNLPDLPFKGFFEAQRRRPIHGD